MLLYVLLACVGIVQCYSGGLVSGSCGSLMPGHGTNGQGSNSPFTVTAGKTTFKEGDEITGEAASATAIEFGRTCLAFTSLYSF